MFFWLVLVYDMSSRQRRGWYVSKGLQTPVFIVPDFFIWVNINRKYGAPLAIPPPQALLNFQSLSSSWTRTVTCFPAFAHVMLMSMPVSWPLAQSARWTHYWTNSNICPGVHWHLRYSVSTVWITRFVISLYSPTLTRRFKFCQCQCRCRCHLSPSPWLATTAVTTTDA